MSFFRKSEIPPHLAEFFEPAEIGLEQTPEAYVAEMVAVFREVRRVLRDDGVLFLNLGDSYASSGGATPGKRSEGIGQATVENGLRRVPMLRPGNPDKNHGNSNRDGVRAPGLKPKDLIGIPWMVAFALRADGWWLRRDIIWCLSGGTRVYARTQKGEMPMTIKDMVRLDPATVQLWNGDKWTQVLGWSETPRPDKTYEIEFRNGQRVGCTANHEWPVEPCGNIRTDELQVGDIVRRCRLPEPETPKSPTALDDEMVGWFVGLYIAEGSKHDGTINIASHTKEELRFAKLREIAAAFHGTAAVHKTSENGCTVALNGPMLCGLIETYISGHLASGKHLHVRCWQRSDRFLRAVLDGYLAGDGHFDAANNRWRLAFCTNDELVADLRAIGARLGISVRLRRHMHKIEDADFPGYKGELRFTRSDHHNSKDDGEIIAIRESRARKFWDIGVADESHLFSLASGILTHNSKPNPMPESVTDRPTSAHEYVFLLTKSARYYWDAQAVREPCESGPSDLRKMAEQLPRIGGKHKTLNDPMSKASAATNIGQHRSVGSGDGRNCRSVWTIATSPLPEAHFATFAPALAERCILAGTSEKGCCVACGAPWVRQIERESAPKEVFAKRVVPTDGFVYSGSRIDGAMVAQGQKLQDWRDAHPSKTTGWLPSCECGAGVTPCVVLDPFGGAGTVGLVADRLRRDAILIELNPEYIEIAKRRLAKDAGMFAEVTDVQASF